MLTLNLQLITFLNMTFRKSLSLIEAVRRRFTLLLRAVFVLLLATGSGYSFAAVTCTGNPNTEVLSFPTVSVPRDASNNTPLTPWVYSGAYTYWTCNASGSTGSGTRFDPISAATGSTYSESGVNYPVFSTDMPGIGVVMTARAYANGCSWLSWGAVGGTPPAGGLCNSNGSISNGGQLGMRLIKIGPITGGILPPQLPVKGVAIAATGTISGAGIKQFSTAPVTINVLSCSVDGVDIQLDPVMKSSFSTAVSPKTKSFAFVLRGCPAGMNTIKYQLDPVNTIISSTNGTFANNTGSDMAKGVGLRITDGTNTSPVRFGDSSYVVPGYSAASGNSTLSVQMNVSYYRTGAATDVTPGQVVGLVQLTIFYL